MDISLKPVRSIEFYGGSLVVAEVIPHTEYKAPFVFYFRDSDGLGYPSLMGLRKMAQM